ncbi:MAG TPA: NADH-quinone oxidoreductase subunit G, partial [Jatrophihabitantaceae bacterium]
WGVASAGRDTEAILRGASTGELDALVVGAVDPADFADPALAYAALAGAGFVVSLEVRRSAVTEHADVVLPVAPTAEKAGRYVTWEGRRRPFDSTITNTGALSDAQVLDALADELDVALGLRTVAAARDELAGFSAYTAAPDSAALRQQRAPLGQGEAVLATWHELLDAGRGQDGDPHLAGTAKPARAIVSAGTASKHALTDRVTVSTDAGSLTVPVEIAVMPDDVVWLPTNSRDCAVRATLRAAHGSTVKLGGGDAA